MNWKIFITLQKKTFKFRLLTFSNSKRYLGLNLTQSNTIQLLHFFLNLANFHTGYRDS